MWMNDEDWNLLLREQDRLNQIDAQIIEARERTPPRWFFGSYPWHVRLTVWFYWQVQKAWRFLRGHR